MTATGPAKTPDGMEVPPLLGHYEVLEKIGQGGMAVVYKGRQPSLNRPVALKILPPQFAGSPELLGRFEREAAIIAQLNHSNIVQVIDRGREGDLLYIVMEYVEGESLERLLRTRKLEPAEIVDIGAQICDALEYAHSLGVVHRDLKPSNILIDRRTGRLKVADFGIAQLETTAGVLATLTCEHTALGTMNYMSPEQRLDAHRVTHLTDIFSLGVILYEMITGKLPIGHFKLPTLLRPDIPLGFDAIVKKCLAEAPADRYQNAGAVREELMRLTTRRARAAAGAPRLLARISPRQRRRLLVAAGAVGVLVLASVGAGVVRKRASGQNGAPPARAAVEADFARARELLAGRDRAGAIAILERLLAEQPRHPLMPELRYTLAMARYETGDAEGARTEFERLLREHPGCARIPEAVVGRCLAEWETAPRRRSVWKGLIWDAQLQQRLAGELTELLKQKPSGPHVVGALSLLARIAEQPAWTNYPLAAESLARLQTAPRGRTARDQR